MLLETIPVLDALTTSTPSTYYNEGNWAKMAWATNAPTPRTTGAGFTTFGTTTASYWKTTSFGGTQAVSMKTNRGSDLSERFWELWTCFNNTSHNGYRAKFTHPTTETNFIVTLFRVTEGSETLLGTSVEIVAEVGDIFGLLREGTKIKAYFKHPSGAYTVATEATDATYTSGFTGFGGQGSDPSFTEFRGGEPAAEIHRAPPARYRLQAVGRSSSF
jgi:hypothetical protein